MKELGMELLEGDEGLGHSDMKVFIKNDGFCN